MERADNQTDQDAVGTAVDLSWAVASEDDRFTSFDPVRNPLFTSFLPKDVVLRGGHGSVPHAVLPEELVKDDVVGGIGLREV